MPRFESVSRDVIVRRVRRGDGAAIKGQPHPNERSLSWEMHVVVHTIAMLRAVDVTYLGLEIEVLTNSKH